MEPKPIAKASFKVTPDRQRNFSTTPKWEVDDMAAWDNPQGTDAQIPKPHAVHRRPQVPMGYSSFLDLGESEFMSSTQIAGVGVSSKENFI